MINAKIKVIERFGLYRLEERDFYEEDDLENYIRGFMWTNDESLITRTTVDYRTVKRMSITVTSSEGAVTARINVKLTYK